MTKKQLLQKSTDRNVTLADSQHNDFKTALLSGEIANMVKRRRTWRAGKQL